MAVFAAAQKKDASLLLIPHVTASFAISAAEGVPHAAAISQTGKKRKRLPEIRNSLALPLIIIAFEHTKKGNREGRRHSANSLIPSAAPCAAVPPKGISSNANIKNIKKKAYPM
ncbi:MAG: hypothetical protein IKH31_06690 [Clostridia bacterium]|nr:hypothetical protein [Clostridia bacterium]